MQQQQETNADNPRSIKAPSANSSNWLCAMEDESSIYLQINEPRSGLCLDVAALILLIKPTDDDIPVEQHTLGKIRRLERDNRGMVSIIVQKLSSQIVNIDIMLSPTKTQKALIAKSNSKHYLLSDHSNKHWTGYTFKGCFPDKSTAIMQLSSLTNISPSFQMLSIS